MENREVEQHRNSEYARSLSRNLLWTGIIMSLVGAKLLLSYIVPGLRTPGELLLSGILLLVYTVRIFALRAGLEKRAGAQTAA